ncbi:hypothetical protein GCM10023319_61640 [Nocardia iowensis]
MLGSPLQLGERRDGLPRRIGQLVVDLQQQRLVTLHNQRTVRHSPSSHRFRPILPDPPDTPARPVR